MNIKTGLVTLSAAALLGLAGCMGTNQDSEQARATNADKVNFIQASSAPLAKSVAQNPGAQSPDEVATQLETIGCPKLAKLFKDLSSYTGQGEFPKSFTEYLQCFGLSATPSIEDIDGISKKFENPVELLNCICGGSGLADILYGSGGAISAFSAASSSAATASFNASASAGTTYKSPSSSEGAYSNPSSNGYSNP